VGKAVPERQTILDFAAAVDEGGGLAAVERTKLELDHHHEHTNEWPTGQTLGFIQLVARL